MQKNAIETLLGAVVLLVAGIFISFLYNSTDFHNDDGYTIYAKFNRVDGLKLGNEIKLGGITIGSIVSQKIDPITYMAVVEMNVDSKIKLPKDSSARVISDGLLGGTFVDIQPGGSEDYIDKDGYISYTQDSVNLIDLLGRFIFSLSESKEK